MTTDQSELQWDEQAANEYYYSTCPEGFMANPAVQGFCVSMAKWQLERANERIKSQRLFSYRYFKALSEKLQSEKVILLKALEKADELIMRYECGGNQEVEWKLARNKCLQDLKEIEGK